MILAELKSVKMLL